MRMSRKLVLPTVWAASILVAASGTAFAAAKITGAHIVDGTIKSIDIADGTVTATDINAKTRRGLVIEAVNKAKNATPGSANAPGAAGAKGADGANGKDGSNGAKGETGGKGDTGAAGANGVAASLGADFSRNNVAIRKIGGSFVANSTTVGTFTLLPGKYVISGSAMFHRLVRPGASTPMFQLALRGPVNAQHAWGEDFGTGFTGELPIAAQDREISTATSTVASITVPTEVKVSVFGYNASGAGTGTVLDNENPVYEANFVRVNAVKVG